MISQSLTEAFIEAGGSRIRYVQAGNGHPIIYLHEAGGLQLSPGHESGCLWSCSYRDRINEAPLARGKSVIRG